MNDTADAASTRRRWLGAIGGAVLGLTAFNVTRSLAIPSEFHFPLNLGLGVGAAVFGWAIGLDRADLGLRRDRLARGLRYGAGAMTVIAVGVAAGVAIPTLRAAFEDDRADIGVAELALRVLVVIPLGTVVVEELAFRGVLFGALMRTTSTVRAVAWSSVLFGLWHVVPAARGLDDGTSTATAVGIVGGTLVATTIAGVVFAWLRVRSGHLLAPTLAHLGTNTIPFVAAWAVMR